MSGPKWRRQPRMTHQSREIDPPPHRTFRSSRVEIWLGERRLASHVLAPAGYPFHGSRPAWRRPLSRPEIRWPGPRLPAPTWRSAPWRPMRRSPPVVADDRSREDPHPPGGPGPSLLNGEVTARRERYLKARTRSPSFPFRRPSPCPISLSSRPWTSDSSNNGRAVVYPGDGQHRPSGAARDGQDPRGRGSGRRGHPRSGTRRAASSHFGQGLWLLRGGLKGADHRHRHPGRATCIIRTRSTSRREYRRRDKRRADLFRSSPNDESARE